jgi:hypothetical protein
VSTAETIPIMGLTTVRGTGSLTSDFTLTIVQDGGNLNRPIEYTVVRDKVFRTGRQRLIVDRAGRWYVTLQNRTNDTWIEIPEDKVDAWREALE